MSEIGSFKYFPVEFDKAGKIFQPQQADALKAALGPSVSDLYVVSHGWNNNKAEATMLYQNLFGHVSERYEASPKDRVFVIAGILWPSVRFDDAELVPGGGESGGGGGGAASAEDGDMSSVALKAKLAKVHAVLDKPEAVTLSELKTLADRVDTGPTAQQKFADALRKCLPHPSADKADGASGLLMSLPGDELFAAMTAPVEENSAALRGQGGALGLNDDAGRATGLGDIFSGAKAAASRLLNLVTYYQMKERAGLIGAGGVNKLLGEIRAARHDLKIHLVGHSFGARLVTAAVNGPVALKPHSMTLLQAAFSHNGFAARSADIGEGFFRQVVTGKKISGPIVATHTINDKAVGIAYALASRLAGDQTTDIGDENDVYGGIGRNGAVRMSDEERVTATMLDPDKPYAFAKGKITNLLADKHIKSHGDVSREASGNVVWYAAVG